uniref:Uncharacterized protein n=1 Tax=Amphora coffeiformis TaxID=265554 RepID=A0A7S3LBD2_9STRA|mmetsp:Transcript_14707/g.27934  ORF Transcript_14707/g.27934 Transcript_14707/m.27934 type:complete len:364 (+) Transcript_14707:143-1234(+)
MAAAHLDEFLLRSAARKGDVQRIREILQNLGDNWSEDMTTGWTPIHEACRRGHFRVVEELLYRDFPLNVTDTHGRTPFLVACENGHEAVVQLLLERGVDKNQAVDHSGDTPLHRVFTTSRNFSIAQRLLDAGAQIDRQNKLHETTMQAIGESLSSIEHDLALLSKKIHTFTVLRIVAMNLPCTEAEKRFFVFLAEQSNAIKKGFASPDTPIDVLGGFRDHNVCFVSMFNRRNVEGRTPLDVIRHFYGRDEADAFFRICARSYLHRASSSPAQCLRSAVSRGNIADFLKAKSFFGQGANEAAANDAGLTPLHCACLYGKTKIVALLLDDGADLWAETSTGHTPFTLATRAGHLSVIEEILRRLI